MNPQCSLTLGPLLFNWPDDRRRDFYARIADESCIDTVCLGEIVCSKRLPFYVDSILESAERLQRGGKRVVLSTLALITSPQECRACSELTQNGAFEVEVNDLTALAYLARGTSFRVGPFVNVYNEGTLRYLVEYGATSICLPPELPLASIAELAQAALPLAAKCEILSFGRIPLAISSRCYHARVKGVTKDSCQFVCAGDDDGLDVTSLNSKAIFAINGVQTLSHGYCNLVRDTDILIEAGVTAFRLSPHSCDMIAVSKIFRDRLEQKISGPAAEEAVENICGAAAFTNGFVFGNYGRQKVAWTQAI